jgi:alkanesulfonate monooxygenase SsuD/methylene tetrahydromethanopterin reductase-like flavin-dependent oxidoreductase (luciferase family)
MVRFGIFSLPTYFPEVDGGLAQFYQHILALLTDSERLGFDIAWCNEHHFHEYGGMIPSPPVLLAAVAARTSRIRLGTSVALLPLHHPLEQAEAYAMLDQISGGRLELGIGRGFMRHDYNSFGVPWEEGQARLLEALAVIEKAWQYRPFSHRGRFFTFEDVAVWPAPLQQPHPPIWGAASFTPESYVWWGSHGYNLLTVIYLRPVEELAAHLRNYRAAAAASGYDPAALQVSTHMQVYCCEDRAVARRTAQEALVRYLTQLNQARLRGQVEPIQIPDIRIEALIEEGRVCVGDPDDCAAIVARARDALGLAGMDCTFYFGGIPYADARRSFELFAREVMPRFRPAPADQARAPVPTPA